MYSEHYIPIMSIIHTHSLVYSCFCWCNHPPRAAQPLPIRSSLDAMRRPAKGPDPSIFRLVWGENGWFDLTIQNAGFQCWIAVFGTLTMKKSCTLTREQWIVGTSTMKQVGLNPWIMSFNRLNKSLNWFQGNHTEDTPVFHGQKWHLVSGVSRCSCNPIRWCNRRCSIHSRSNKDWLVVLTILKNMSSSMGFGWHPIYEMENKPVMFETTNQLVVIVVTWKNLRRSSHPKWLPVVKHQGSRGLLRPLATKAPGCDCSSPAPPIHRRGWRRHRWTPQGLDGDPQKIGKKRHLERKSWEGKIGKIQKIQRKNTSKWKG